MSSPKHSSRYASGRFDRESELLAQVQDAADAPQPAKAAQAHLTATQETLEDVTVELERVKQQRDKALAMAQQWELKAGEHKVVSDELLAACKNASNRIHLVPGKTGSDKEYLDIAEKILLAAIAAAEGRAS